MLDSNTPLLGHYFAGTRRVLAKRICKRVGRRTIIYKNVKLYDGVCLGKSVFVGNRSSIGSYAQIGNNTLIAHNVTILCINHIQDDDQRWSQIEIKPVVGDNCWIGAKAILVPGVHVGNNVTIGAGSVVEKDVPDGVLVAGNPATIGAVRKPKW